MIQGDVKSGSTFSVSIGHHTVSATITLFSDMEKEGLMNGAVNRMIEKLKEGSFGVNLFDEEVNSFDFDRSYEYTEVMNIFLFTVDLN